MVFDKNEFFTNTPESVLRVIRAYAENTLDEFGDAALINKATQDAHCYILAQTVIEPRRRDDVGQAYFIWYENGFADEAADLLADAFRINYR